MTLLVICMLKIVHLHYVRNKKSCTVTCDLKKTKHSPIRELFYSAQILSCINIISSYHSKTLHLLTFLCGGKHLCKLVVNTLYNLFIYSLLCIITAGHDAQIWLPVWFWPVNSQNILEIKSQYHLKKIYSALTSMLSYINLYYVYITSHDCIPAKEMLGKLNNESYVYKRT